MKKEIYEIREDVRRYIFEEVKLSLSRLGIMADLQEIRTSDPSKDGHIMYHYVSGPIIHTPMMFRKLVVNCNIWSKELKEDDLFFKASAKNDVIAVSLEYKYEHFDGGRNGCDIGTMTFFVRKDIPAKFDDCFGIDFYVRKIKGLEI